jgi:2-haloacid dehalogenase
MFDLGSVLIGWRPELVYRKLIRDPDLRAWFLAEVARAPWDSEPDREEAFAEGLQRLADSGQPVELIAKPHDRRLQEMLIDMP